MKLKIKKLNTMAVMPVRARPGDAGLDLVATSSRFSDGQFEYGTGLAVEIPEGYVGLLFPRSSIHKTGLFLCNSVGVIDSGYRGELIVKFYTPRANINSYKVGDRVAQLVLVKLPEVDLIEVDELSETIRGWGIWLNIMYFFCWPGG